MSEIGTCKTCLWWDADSRDHIRPNCHHCSHPKIYGDLGGDGDDCMFPCAFAR